MATRYNDVETRLRRLAQDYDQQVPTVPGFELQVMSRIERGPRETPVRRSGGRELLLAAAVLVFVAVLAFGVTRMRSLNNPGPVQVTVTASPSVTPSASASASASPSVSPNVSPSASAPATTVMPGFPTAREAAQDGANKQTSGTCGQATCYTLGQQVDGTQAAYFPGRAGTGPSSALCYTYVFQGDGAAWYFLDMPCAQSGAIFAAIGKEDTVQVTGGGCANVRANPSVSAAVQTCLANGTAVVPDGGPTWVDETDAAGHRALHLWWHIKGRGWMAHDALVPDFPPPHQ